MANYTAEYRFIDVALTAHSRTFGQLEAQMDRFQALPLDAFQNERERMWTELRPINRETSDEDLARFIDEQIAAGHSAEIQFVLRFMEPFAAEAVTITVLSHALVEAIINAVMAIGLAHVGKPRLFAILERSSVKHKWTIGPQAFLPDYVFPRSSLLLEALSTLCKRRNAYSHPKITLRDERNRVLIPGSGDAALSVSFEGRTWLRRFLSLPYDLHRYILTQIKDDSLNFKVEHILDGTARASR
jgi:hypothetical protein